MAQEHGVQGFTSMVGRLLFRAQNDLILHHHPFSFYSRLILMAFYEKQLPFTAQVVNTSNEDQYYDGGLGFSHLGDYPVLWDGKNNVAIKDPADIVRHLDKHYPGKANLQPDDRSESYIANEIVRRVQHLRLETLTYGSIMFDDLDLDPQGPYRIEELKYKMLECLKKRHEVFHDELGNDIPLESNAGRNDLDGWHLLQSSENFEALVAGFERELDHCESELRNHCFQEKDPSKQWLCASKITFADISLGITLWHLDQLGYYKRMISPRPILAQYYNRMSQIESFKRATTYPPVFLPASLCPPVTKVEAQRRILQAPDNPWSLIFLLLPFGMIAVIGIVDFFKPLQPHDPYYVPRVRPSPPMLQYRSN